MNRNTVTRRLLTALAILAVVAGCASDPETVIAESGDEPTTVSTPAPTTPPSYAEAWAASGVDDYTMTYVPICFCPQAELTVTVVDGEVVEFTATGDSVGYEPLTVAAMYEQIDRAIAEGAASVEIDQGADGEVVRFYIDEDELLADEEFGVEVSSFEPAG